MPLFSSRHRNNTYSASAGKQPSSPVQPSALAQPLSPVTQSSRRRGTDSRKSRSPGYAGDRSGSPLSDTHDPYDDSGSPQVKGDHTGRRSRGLFRRRPSSPSDRVTHVAQDQTLMNARAKISNAEAAGRSADAASNAAREATREAKDHVNALEREAVEDTRRAKMKKSEAKTVRKSLRGLGRHG